MTSWTGLKMIQKMGVAALTSSADDVAEFEVGQLLLDVNNGRIYAIRSTNTTDNSDRIYFWGADGSISLSFSVSSFSDNQASPQLIGGDGKWEDGSDLTYTATFDNGPPTANPTVAWTTRPAQGVGTQTNWSSAITLLDGDDNGSYIGTGSDSTHDVDYPDVAETLTWTVTGVKSSESDTAAVSVVFYNDIYSGGSNQTTWTDAEIKGSSHFETKLASLSNSRARTLTFNPGSDEHCVYTYPTRLGALTKITDVSSGAEVTWVRTTQADFTNAGANGGYDEDYYIYRSPQTNLGSGIQFEFE
jgi:hypothetical protein